MLLLFASLIMLILKLIHWLAIPSRLTEQMLSLSNVKALSTSPLLKILVILVKWQKFQKSWKKKPENWLKLHNTSYADVQAQNLVFADIPLHLSMALYHKKRSVIHALARVDTNDDRPDVDQQQLQYIVAWKHVWTRWGNVVKRTPSQNIESPHQNLW